MRPVADSGLIAELALVVGSRQEATWIVEHADDPAEARTIARRRAAGEPLQYLLGTWPFRSLELEIDARALIPRPETEQTVDAALTRWRATRPGGGGLWIVDLGTGSGAIGLSLATELADETPVESLVLTDRSAAALELATANASRLGVDAELHLGSWGDAVPTSSRGRFHLLVSNPPYIAADERLALDPVLDHEPDEALVSPAGTDGTPGFGDVETVLEHAWWLLAPGGVVTIEMAEHQVDAALRLAATLGFVDPQGFADLAQHPRGITAVRP